MIDQLNKEPEELARLIERLKTLECLVTKGIVVVEAGWDADRVICLMRTERYGSCDKAVCIMTKERTAIKPNENPLQNAELIATLWNQWRDLVSAIEARDAEIERLKAKIRKFF